VEEFRTAFSSDDHFNGIVNRLRSLTAYVGIKLLEPAGRTDCLGLHDITFMWNPSNVNRPPGQRRPGAGAVGAGAVRAAEIHTPTPCIYSMPVHTCEFKPHVTAYGGRFGIRYC
jgi:hypothetical protein